MSLGLRFTCPLSSMKLASLPTSSMLRMVLAAHILFLRDVAGSRALVSPSALDLAWSQCCGVRAGSYVLLSLIPCPHLGLCHLSSVLLCSRTRRTSPCLIVRNAPQIHIRYCDAVLGEPSLFTSGYHHRLEIGNILCFSPLSTPRRDPHAIRHGPSLPMSRSTTFGGMRSEGR
ncbi:hypothetical protein H4582DRAFT_1318383 [Lactarius indigo]|nr:hypothetical protein H4582DRAFT_1318383 [Lactarius indigo]